LRICIATLKPPPSGPSRFSFGTSTSSKYADVVGLARSPILSSWALTETPARSRVTMKAES
jgi:hypothetical protein